MFGIEKKKENRIIRKKMYYDERLKLNDETADDESPAHLKYGLGANSLFLRLYDTSMNHFSNWKLMRSMIFGQKLIMDCGYEDKMSRSEAKNCAKQLQFAFAANRALDDPFDLVFCNLPSTGILHDELYSYIPTMYQKEFPINFTNQSYLDLYDKKSLVYLTPDCNKELNKYDDDDIYIIGAIVDKVIIV